MNCDPCMEHCNHCTSYNDCHDCDYNYTFDTGSCRLISSLCVEGEFFNES